LPIKKSRYLVGILKKIRNSLSKLKNDLEEEKEAPKYVTAATREIERWRPPRWISLFFIYFLSSSACGSFFIIGFQSLKQRSRIKEDELLFSSLLFSALLFFLDRRSNE
jgi:hypothetical protein